MSTNKRISEIDILYTIGIFLVIFGHSHYSDWSLFTGTFLESLIVFIYTFHMPLFFFISGFLFMNSNSLKVVGYQKWIKNKFIKLMIPYLVLSVIMIAPKCYLDNHSFDSVFLYVINIFVYPRLGVWGHLWFIPTLLILYLVFGLIGKKINTYLLLAFSIFLYFLPLDSNILCLNDIKNYTVYFIIGMIFNDIYARGYLNKIMPGAHHIFLCLILSIYIYIYSGQNKILTLIDAILLIICCFILAKIIKENIFFRWMSKHNFTFYLYSWPFQYISMIVCNAFNLHYFLASIIMFIVGLIMPFFMISIYKWLNLSKYYFLNLIFGIN